MVTNELKAETLVLVDEQGSVSGAGASRADATQTSPKVAPAIRSAVPADVAALARALAAAFEDDPIFRWLLPDERRRFDKLLRFFALELGAVVTFAAFAAVSLVVAHHTGTDVARYARGIAAAALSVIAFASLLFVPFTEQYARERVDERFWSSPQFKAINRKLTIMWGAVFAAMVPFHILAGALDRPGTNILFNWVVPVALVVWAAKRSTGAGEDPTVNAVA